MTSVDVTSTDMLAELHQALHEAGIRIVRGGNEGPGQGQAEAIRTSREVWRGRRSSPTVGSAVSNYLQRYPVEHPGGK